MRSRRITALLTAVVLGAGLVATLAQPAAAVNPPQQWRSPKGPGLAFAKDSTVLSPMFAANMLSTDGSWITFLQLDDASLGTGKIWQHKSGTTTSQYISKPKNGSATWDGGWPFGVRSESSNSGYHGITFVNSDTISTDPNSTTPTRTAIDLMFCNSSFCFPTGQSGANDYTTQGVDDTGRYLLFGMNLNAKNDNGTPNNPNDDYAIGGTLSRMDAGTGHTCWLAACPSIQIAGASQSIGGVTSAAFAATGGAKVYYSQFDATYQTQKLKYQATVVANGAGTDIALPAPFNGSPYPAHLSIQVIDESADGNYLLFGVVDSSGAIDGGRAHYYVRKNTAPVEFRELPLAPAGQPAFVPTSVGNDGSVGVAQDGTGSTPIEPKVVKWDGNIWPVGPAEDRSAHGALAFTAVSGDGNVVAYPTALPIESGDTNGLDDFASVQMSQVPAPPMGHLPTANGGSNKTVNEGSTVTIDASASNSNDAGQPILRYRFDLDNNGSIDQEGTKPTFSFNAGDGPAVRTVGVSVVDPDGTSPVVPVTITVNNLPPVISQANVTPRTGTVGTTQFTYTVGSITDPGGDPFTVTWDFNGDGTPDATIASGQNPNPPPYTFTQTGTFVGNVKATDKDGASATMSLPTVRVDAVVGHLPTANAGADQTVDEGSQVTIDASASSANDSGQSIGTYIFDKGRDGLIDQQGSNPVYKFTAPNGPSTVQVGVRVVDPDGTSPEAVVTITVRNVPPVITGATVSPTSGTTNVTDFNYSVASVVDPGGDPVTVKWDFDGDGTTDYTGTTPPPRKFTAPGTYNGTVTATDADGDSSVATLPQVTVADTPPVGHLPTASAGGDQTVDEGSQVTIDASASSPNDTGQSISSYRFDLDNNGSIDQQGASPTFTFPAGSGPATRTVAVTVVDPDGTSAPAIATITVRNLPPTIGSATVTPTSGLVVDQQFDYAATGVSDPGGGPVTVTWDFDGNGTTDATGPTASTHFSTIGTYNGKVTATDGAGASTTVNLDPVTVKGHPPTASAGGNQTVDEGSQVTIDASASSPNDAGQSISSYRFDLDNNGSIDQQGVSPTFTFPAGEGPATRTVAVTVVDPDATSAPALAAITVRNLPPTIGSASVSPTSGTARDTVFGYAASSVSDPGGGPVTVTWDFDGNGTADATGLIATKTFDIGTYNGKVTATDRAGMSTTVNLDKVTVTGHPPTASAGPAQTVNEGSQVTIDASASSSNDVGQSITNYSFDLGNDGTVDQSGPSPTFKFSAPNGPSTVVVAVKVTDPDGTSAPATATITVNNVAPVVTGAAVTPSYGVQGVTPFAFSVASVTDPGGDTFTVSWDFGDGSPPVTGLTPPAHVYAAAGSYQAKVTATDSDGAATTVNLPTVNVTSGGGGDPNADDDGDGIRNKFDGDPLNPHLLDLNNLCGSGTYAGTGSGTGQIGGCLTLIPFFRLHLGNVRVIDGPFRMDGFWLFANTKVRTAPNAAFYRGRSLYGFSWTKGFLWVDYEMAVFDNGSSGDRIVLEAHGAAGDYSVDQVLQTGDFKVS